MMVELLQLHFLPEHAVFYQMKLTTDKRTVSIQDQTACSGPDLCPTLKPLFSPMVQKRNNLLPEDKILALSKLKALADDNFNAAQVMQFSLKDRKK